MSKTRREITRSASTPLFGIGVLVMSVLSFIFLLGICIIIVRFLMG
ncbi:MAG: hypothetical protein RR236_03765 [Raoultibacter sp.]